MILRDSMTAMSILTEAVIRRLHVSRRLRDVLRLSTTCFVLLLHYKRVFHIPFETRCQVDLRALSLFMLGGTIHGSNLHTKRNVGID